MGNVSFCRANSTHGDSGEVCESQTENMPCFNPNTPNDFPDCCAPGLECVPDTALWDGNVSFCRANSTQGDSGEVCESQTENMPCFNRKVPSDFPDCCAPGLECVPDIALWDGNVSFCRANSTQGDSGAVCQRQTEDMPCFNPKTPNNFPDCCAPGLECVPEVVNWGGNVSFCKAHSTQIEAAFLV